MMAENLAWRKYSSPDSEFRAAITFLTIDVEPTVDVCENPFSYDGRHTFHRAREARCRIKLRVAGIEDVGSLIHTKLPIEYRTHSFVALISEVSYEVDHSMRLEMNGILVSEQAGWTSEPCEPPELVPDILEHSTVSLPSNPLGTFGFTAKQAAEAMSRIFSPVLGPSAPPSEMPQPITHWADNPVMLAEESAKLARVSDMTFSQALELIRAAQRGSTASPPPPPKPQKPKPRLDEYPHRAIILED